MSTTTKNNRIGAISLSISVVGMLFFYLFSVFVKDTIFIQMLVAGFEAAVVGGVADWFAVTALFKEIPIPILRKHTNIIVKSRNKLTSGIVSLVAEQWLSKESIISKIRDFLSVTFLSNQLASDENQKLFIRSVVKTLNHLLGNVEIKKLQETLQNLSSQLVQIPKINLFLCKIATNYLENKKHHKNLIFCFDKLHEVIKSDLVLKELEQVVYDQITAYKESKSSLTKAVLNLTQSVGGIDYAVAALKIQNALCSFVEELKNNPTHSVRLEIDRELFNLFSTAKGQHKLEKFLEDNFQELKSILFSEKNTENIIEYLQPILKNKDSKFNQQLSLFVGKQANHLATDNFRLQEIQGFLMDTLFKLVDKNHDIVAKTVSDNLSKLNDRALVEQIESKVGNQLQYIRLNGAIIGGLVGCLLFLLKQLVH